MAKGTCNLNGCNCKAHARGLCRKHWGEAKGTGSLPPTLWPKPGACAVEGCAEIARSVGYCNGHYLRLRKTGQLGAASIGRRRADVSCAVYGCDRLARTRGYCDPHYRRSLSRGEPGSAFIRPAPKAGQTCAVPGCDRVHNAHGYCHTHAARWRRTGDPGPAQIKGDREPGPCMAEGCDLLPPTPRGRYCMLHGRRLRQHGELDLDIRSALPAKNRAPLYVTAYMPDHPTAGQNGRAYVHRAVLYDAIGPGEHRCHWCARLVDWDLHRPHPFALVVDHLNDDPTDNRIENLVPACNRCNITRGVQRRHWALAAMGFFAGVPRVAV